MSDFTPFRSNNQPQGKLMITEVMFICVLLNNCPENLKLFQEKTSSIFSKILYLQLFQNNFFPEHVRNSPLVMLLLEKKDKNVEKNVDSIEKVVSLNKRVN